MLSSRLTVERLSLLPKRLFQNDLIQVANICFANYSLFSCQLLDVIHSHVVSLHLFIFTDSVATNRLALNKQEFGFAVRKGISFDMIRVVVPFQTKLLSEPLLVFTF